MLSNAAVEVNNDKDTTTKKKTKKDTTRKRSHLTTLGRFLNFKLEKSIVSIKYSTI